MKQEGNKGCAIDACPYKHLAGGLCSVHYYRKRRGNVMEKPVDNNLDAEEPITETEFCMIRDFWREGFDREAIAHEIQKPVTKVRQALEFESWYEYKLGRKYQNYE